MWGDRQKYLPKEARHARERRPDYELPSFTRQHYGVASLRVCNIDIMAKRENLHSMKVVWSVRTSKSGLYAAILTLRHISAHMGRLRSTTSLYLSLQQYCRGGCGPGMNDKTNDTAQTIVSRLSCKLYVTKTSRSRSSGLPCSSPAPVDNVAKSQNTLRGISVSFAEAAWYLGTSMLRSKYLLDNLKVCDTHWTAIVQNCLSTGGGVTAHHVEHNPRCR